jgi:hypothetical protein
MVARDGSGQLEILCLSRCFTVFCGVKEWL